MTNKQLNRLESIIRMNMVAISAYGEKCKIGKTGDLLSSRIKQTDYKGEFNRIIGLHSSPNKHLIEHLERSMIARIKSQQEAGKSWAKKFLNKAGGSAGTMEADSSMYSLYIVIK